VDKGFLPFRLGKVWVMSTTEPVPAPGHASAAVAQLLGALAGLEDGETWALSSGELAALTEGLYRASGSLSAHALRALAELDARGLALEAGAASTAGWLVGRLRMGPGQARRQVALARALADLPVTLGAVAGGQVSVEQAEVVAKTLAQLPAVVDEGTAAGAEAQLLAHAEQFFPARLARVGGHLLAVLDPDGAEPSQRDPGPALPYLRVRTLPDGWCEGEFRLDPATALAFSQVLGAASAPQPAQDGTRDERSPDKRRFDGFADLARLAAGSTPRPGATRPTIAVTMTLEELTNGLPVLGPDLQTLTPGDVRRLACDAKVVPAVLGSDSEVLDLGRTVRTVTPAQLKALTVRDGGCVNPYCRKPPEYCDAHHVDHWLDGGPSDLGNYALVCGTCHDHVHHHGYAIKMVNGKPVWTEPDWLRQPWRSAA
jgi:Domain of unknown function (DUF222)/HNH endonuclease